MKKNNQYDNIMIKVLDYIPKLDCFKATKDYKSIAKKLGLMEWNPVVWIGRYFYLDNDYGEHWFDNFEERKGLEKKARCLGYDIEELLVLVPENFQNGKDGPCHPPELRKRFWTDALRSFHISLSTLFEEARHKNQKHTKLYPGKQGLEFGLVIPDLEERITKIKARYSN